MKFVLESIFSVFIVSKLFIFFLFYSIMFYYKMFYKKSHLIMDESVLMLYYTAFYEITHRPYILEFYIIDIFSLSLILPFIHSFLLYFAFQLKIIFIFART